MWLSLTCAFLVFVLSSATPVTTSSEQQQHRCGRYLRETLALVCKGTGYYGRDKKGSVGNRRVGHYNHVRKLYKRQRSQIVEECCKRSCSLDTLKMYCNDDMLQDSSAQMSVSAEAFLKTIKETEATQSPATTSNFVDTITEETDTQNTNQNTVAAGEGVLDETDATEDDYHQSFGSYSFPDKQKYKFVWAVLYDDQNQNNNNFQV